MRLSHRVAVVTGGARGIGAAISRRFALEGARVAVLDIDTSPFDDLPRRTEPGPSLAIRCDVSQETEVVEAIEEVARLLGSIDILVNNAGVRTSYELIEDTSEEDWDRLMDVHLRGCFLCTKHAVPHMKAHGRGAIVNIASLAGVRGRPLRHSYVAAKHGIVGLTRSVAMEGLPYNIRANAIAPGPVARDGDPPASREEWDALLHAHRASGGSKIDLLIERDAVAAAALFLASDEAPNITGVILPIDGGAMAGSPLL